jgi:hypothetical protein
MPKYSVMWLQPMSTIVYVEAENWEDAVTASVNGLPGSLCWECNGKYEESGEAQEYQVADEDGNAVAIWSDEDGQMRAVSP